MLECVINLSEGRDLALLNALRDQCGPSMRDLHTDEFHHRSVYTLINDAGALVADVHALISAAFDRIDLSTHEGVHPRLGVVDVVPFVALGDEPPDRALFLRDETAQWIASTFDVPVFRYGPLDGEFRTLPEIRKRAFRDLAPDFGPSTPSPNRGASAVGARDVLVAWNLWLTGVSRDETRSIAKAIRRNEVRALAFRTGAFTQVSCNLVDPTFIGPSLIYDEVAALLPDGGEIVKCELVGLLPDAVLATQSPSRWGQLGLSKATTIEAVLA